MSKKQEQGVCPKCGNESLNYETISDIGEEGICYPYICDDCGFEGNEWYNIEFSEHLTREGEQIDE